MLHFETAPPWIQVATRFLALAPAILDGLSGVFEDDSCWFVGQDLEGTRVIRLPSSSPLDATVLLFRAPAGGLIPEHQHGARESALVLRGGFREIGGRSARAGDLLVTEPGTHHALVVDPDEDCIFAVRMDFIGAPKLTLRDTGLRRTASVCAG